MIVEAQLEMVMTSVVVLVEVVNLVVLEDEDGDGVTDVLVATGEVSEVSSATGQTVV